MKEEQVPIDGIYWLIGSFSLLIILAIIFAILDYKEEKKRANAFFDLIGYVAFLYLSFKSRQRVSDDTTKKSP